MKRTIVLETAPSTNSVLREMAAAGAAAGQVVIARRQTAGRGRLGRTFASPEGGLYLSYLFRSETNAATLTARAAVAACRAVGACCGAEPAIKWVNDLMLAGRKIGGILAESSADARGERFVVMGIGINVNGTAASLPPEVRETAGYLSELTGRAGDTETLARTLVAELDRLRQGAEPAEAWLAEYRRRCLTVGRPVAVLKPEGAREATALAVNDDYSLAVQYADGGTEDVFTGEVSVKLR